MSAQADPVNYSVACRPPPKPSSYPATIRFLDWYGIKEMTVRNDDEYYALVFWYWHCVPSF